MLNLRQGSITTHFNMPKFCGSVDAGTQHSGSQPAVGLNCNGVWELKHTAHGVSGYYDNYWWEIYPWFNQTSSFGSRMFRKTSDNTWVMIQNNGTIRYTNPSKSSAPPTSGWVTTGGSGATPVPQITFNQIVTEQSSLSLTNCSETARTSNSVTIESDSSSGTKNIIFGTNIFSVDDKIAVGFKLKTTGIANGAVGNLLLGGSVFMASYSIENVDESPNARLHSFDQVVGRTQTGASYSPTSTGLTMQNYTNVFPDGATMEIIDLRIFKL